MSRKEILSKLEAGESLSKDELLLLDKWLEEQKPISELLSALPKEEPSLDWRADLQSRLLASASKSKRAAGWPFRMAGVTLAGAIASYMLISLFSIDQEPRLTTDTILQWHEEAVATTALASDGTGLAGLSTLPANSNRKDEDLFDGGALPAL